ncbi:MAG: PEP-CTERM sorting domain-containing protein [Burkholderiales bacterium]
MSTLDQRTAPAPAVHASRLLICAQASIFALVMATAATAQAAEVQVSTRATAIDIGHDFVVNVSEGSAGRVQGTPPLLSLSTSAGAGIVDSFSSAAANAYTGQISGMVQSVVGDTAPLAGRGGSATSIGSMTGSITVSGPAPGMASFSAVIEGAYNFGSAPARYFNTGNIEGNGIIGDVYRGLDIVNFDPRTSNGLFSYGLTWTLPVEPGQTLDMSFYLHMLVTSQVDIASVSMLHTFKLTSIDLPAGYTYTSDAEGFLSEFTPSPVPEPASATLLLAGALALAWRRRAVLRP